MKRLRYLVVVLLLVGMVALTGCLPSASKLRGTWKSTEAIGGYILEVTFGEHEGAKVPFIGFLYSYKTTIKWGAKQWTIDANKDADEDSANEYSIWAGLGSENVLDVWKYSVVDEDTYIDFKLTAKLDGTRLYIDYLVIDNVESINNGEFGPEYLTK
mgnify:CR=1 FL=1